MTDDAPPAAHQSSANLSSANNSAADASAKLAPWLPRPGRGPVFPGRARIFGTVPPGISDAFAIDPATAAGEWPGASPGILAAAAVGAAFAERARGGRVIAILPAHSAAGDALVAAAADLAETIGLDNLAFAGCAEGADDPSPMAPQEGFEPPASEAISLWRPQQSQRWFLADDLPSNPVLTLPVAGSRREWPAVQVHGLGAGGIPPWPVDPTHDGRQAAAAALAHVAAQTPALLRPHADAPWSALTPDLALLHALAQLAAEGRRVAWLLPSGTPLRPWLGALNAIGRRGLGLKIILDANDLPDVATLAGLTTWWTLLPYDANDTAAALANALDHDDPCLIGLPGATQAVPAPLTAWTPGAGRWLATGASGTIVAAHATPVALALSEALRPQACGVLRCNSLMPLPVAELLAAPRPLLVVEDAHSRGLTAAITQVLADPLLANPRKSGVADASAAPAIRLAVAHNAKIPDQIISLLPLAKSAITGV